MNSKQRVLRTVQRQETDRVAMDMTYTNAANIKRLKRYFSCSSDEELFRKLGIDLWWISGPLRYIGKQRYYNGEKADFWGRAESVYEGKYGDSGCPNPLKGVSSIDQVEQYDWPSIADFDTAGLEDRLNSHSEFAIIGGVWAPIFHDVCWLCGIEDTYVNLLIEPEIVEALIRRVTDFWIAYTRKTLEAARGRIDIVENCNCFGGQKDLVISPAVFRKFMKPALKRLYDTIKEYNVLIFQHSCGAIEPIIGDFIELGADIINPVQVSAYGMDPVVLKKKYGKDVTFCGGIDTQRVLPFGTAEEVRAECRRISGILGDGGGYILGGSQALEDDIPEENVLAMFDEGRMIKLRID